MEFGKKLISNTTFLLIDWVILTIFSYLFWLILGRFFSTKEYGIVSTVINTSIILSSISLLGLGTAVTKLIPEYLQRRKINMPAALTKFSLKIILASNLIISIVLIVLANQISPFLKVDPIYVILIGLLTLATSVSNFSTSVLQGFQEMKKISVTDSVGTIIRTTFSFLFLLLFLTNLIPILMYILSLFVTFFLRFRMRWISSNSVNVDYNDVLKHYAFPALASSIAWMIFTNAQYLILTITQGPSVTGIFSIAAISTTLIAIIPSTVSNALFPILSQLSVGRLFKKQQKFYISMTLRYTIAVSLPLAMIFILFPTKIILLFSSGGDYLNAKSLFPLLAISALLNGFGILASQSLYALKETKLYRNIIVTTAVIFLVLGPAFTLMFSAMGLVVAYTMTMIFFFAVSFYYLKRFVNFDNNISNIIRIVIASSVWLAAFTFMAKFVTSFILQWILLGAFSVIYFLSLLFLRFYTREDLRVMEFVGVHVPQVRTTIRKVSSIVERFMS